MAGVDLPQGEQPEVVGEEPLSFGLLSAYFQLQGAISSTRFGRVGGQHSR